MDSFDGIQAAAKTSRLVGRLSRSFLSALTAISEDLVFEAADAAAVEAVAGLLPQPFDCAGIVIAVAEIVI